MSNPPRTRDPRLRRSPARPIRYPVPENYFRQAAIESEIEQDIPEQEPVHQETEAQESAIRDQFEAQEPIAHDQFEAQAPEAYNQFEAQEQAEAENLQEDEITQTHYWWNEAAQDNDIGDIALARTDAAERTRSPSPVAQPIPIPDPSSSSESSSSSSTPSPHSLSSTPEPPGSPERHADEEIENIDQLLHLSFELYTWTIRLLTAFVYKCFWLISMPVHAVIFHLLVYPMFYIWYCWIPRPGAVRYAAWRPAPEIEHRMRRCNICCKTMFFASLVIFLIFIHLINLSVAHIFHGAPTRDCEVKEIAHKFAATAKDMTYPHIKAAKDITYGHVAGVGVKTFEHIATAKDSTVQHATAVKDLIYQQVIAVKNFVFVYIRSFLSFFYHGGMTPVSKRYVDEKIQHMETDINAIWSAINKHTDALYLQSDQHAVKINDLRDDLSAIYMLVQQHAKDDPRLKGGLPGNIQKDIYAMVEKIINEANTALIAESLYTIFDLNKQGTVEYSVWTSWFHDEAYLYKHTKQIIDNYLVLAIERYLQEKQDMQVEI